MRIFASVLCLLCAWAAPALAECNVELKPTDDYRKLSEKLKCLKDEIAALKGGGSTGAKPAALQKPAAPGSVTANGGALVFEFQKCNAEQQYIRCHFQVTNTTREDQKACITDGARMVLRSGAAFSRNFGAWMGSKYDSNSLGVCDEITPLSQVKASIRVHVDKPEPIQFLRVMCGADCKYEAYDVPLN